MKRMLRGATALVTVAGLLEPAFAADLRPLVATQPDPSADVAPYFVADTDPRWTDADWSKQDIEALRGKVKYVFVIFNENRSFDHEYGTFPGVNGLFRRKKCALARRHAGLHADLCRHKCRGDHHGSAVSRRPGAELDI